MSELTERYFRQMFVPCNLLKFLLESRYQKLFLVTFQLVPSLAEP